MLKLVWDFHFREDRITAMQSLHGETVELSSAVEVTQDIEVGFFQVSQSTNFIIKISNHNPSSWLQLKRRDSFEIRRVIFGYKKCR